MYLELGHGADGSDVSDPGELVGVVRLVRLVRLVRAPQGPGVGLTGPLLNRLAARLRLRLFLAGQREQSVL